MIEVIDQEFYHIHRTTSDNIGTPNRYADLWQVGNCLEFGNSTNLLFDRVYNPEFNLECDKSRLQWLVRQNKADSNASDKRELQHDFFQESFMFKYLQLAREVVLEEVRRIHFKDQPSRLRGIWLSDKESIPKWKKIFPAGDYQQKIFLVKFSGKVHKGDERWITNQSLSFQSYFNNAVSYWQGVRQSQRGKPAMEYICEGTVSIVSEFKK